MIRFRVDGDPVRSGKPKSRIMCFRVDEEDFVRLCALATQTTAHEEK
jgi:hypothetical protein